MSTPNIEELINNLTIKAGVMEMGEKIAWGSDTALMRQAAATLQSQAEHIAELECESETHAKAYGLAIVERNNLRHELKVAQEGWRCESAGMKPLFTRHMPAQDVTELVEALQTMFTVFTDIDSGEVDRKLAIKDARTALANAKGAKP